MNVTLNIICEDKIFCIATLQQCKIVKCATEINLNRSYKVTNLNRRRDQSVLSIFCRVAGSHEYDDVTLASQFFFSRSDNHGGSTIQQLSLVSEARLSHYTYFISCR